MSHVHIRVNAADAASFLRSAGEIQYRLGAAAKRQQLRKAGILMTLFEVTAGAQCCYAWAHNAEEAQELAQHQMALARRRRHSKADKRDEPDAPATPEPTTLQVRRLFDSAATPFCTALGEGGWDQEAR